MNTFNFGNCSKPTRDKIIVCQEKGKKFTGLNDNEKKILKVQIDGCLKIQGLKCDWLLIDEAGNIANFIELKGCDLKHAFQQLEHTIIEISNPQRKYISEKFTKKIAYLIISYSPLSSAKLENKKKEFRKKLNTSLIIKKDHLKEKL